MENEQSLWRRFIAALQVPEPPPSDDFVSRVMAQIPALSEVEAPAERDFRLARWLVPTFGVAAAALALLVVSPNPEVASAEQLLLAGADTESSWLFQQEAPNEDDAISLVAEEL